MPAGEVSDAEVRVDGHGSLRVTDLAAEFPVFADQETLAKVTVEGVADPDTPEPVEATATVEVPRGWTAGWATQTLAPGSTVTVEVPVTAPAGPPPPGGQDDR